MLKIEILKNIELKWSKTNTDHHFRFLKFKILDPKEPGLLTIFLEWSGMNLLCIVAKKRGDDV